MIIELDIELKLFFIFFQKSFNFNEMLNMWIKIY